MSFFDSITKKAKLKAAIKQTTEARSSEGAKADQLFNKVYHDYAEVVANEPLIAEALYNWGFALLHQARTKSGEQAAKLYQDAIAKFSFCLTIEPAYLGAAIDGGVAFMELARIKAVGLNDGLYASAQSYFEKANAIQAGSASYNLACIYGLRGDKEACLTALEISKGKGSLPAAVDIREDPDLNTVKNQDWFVAFMESLNKVKVPEVETKINEAVVEAVVDDVQPDVAVKNDAAAVDPFKAAVEAAPVSDETEVAVETVVAAAAEIK
ncbi:MAG: hypothetical protein PSV18_06905 [Methylobacter sp.]|uniref:Tetratricopeptide repeat protein n=1 Tax=Candidatus Methylobacter titanis TaxID=3053457 RepID=A0AA43TM41_9GAMM|nr:hypothetical protein [Candidatus Methylobacter titanis]MDI1292458.1 hypothetical protein [Candidatus Methylobacter titanis]